MREYFVWVERYRPQTLSDCILPESLRQMIRGIISQQNMTNLLLTGKAGVGKTTLAKVLTKELDAETLVINASEENGIDVIRTKIKDFASAMSLSSTRKYVILDEADYLHPTSTQPALRAFMEEFAHVCGFILTANHPSRIIAPLHSRCSVIDFRIAAADRPQIATEYAKRAMEILALEKVTFDRKVVTQVVAMYFPDFRRVLNELQRHSSTGDLSESILSQLSDKDISELHTSLSKGDFSGIRKWIALHDDIDATSFYRMLGEQVPKWVSVESLPELIIQMADYGFRAGTCADPQLNNLACLVELMHSGKWK